MTFQGGWCSESPLSLSIIIRHYPSICPSFYLAPPRAHGTSGPCAKVQSRPWPELTEIQALRAMVGLQFRYLIWPLIKRGGQNYHWSNSICSPKFLGWIKVLLISVLFFMFVLHYLVGGFNPSEKYESQLGLNMSSSVGMMKFQIYGKIKNVPNHQPGDIKTMAILKIPWQRICFTFYKQRCKVRGNTTNNHRVITQYCRAWNQSMNPQNSIFI